jgi:hypothetical protein
MQDTFTRNKLEPSIILKSFNISKRFYYVNTSYQEEATHKNGGKKADDQAMAQQ